MVARFVKPMIAPVLIAQAMRLRKVALELPEPTGAREGVAAPLHGADSSRTLSVLIAGDSSAAGVGAATQDEALAPQLAAALANRVGREVRWHLFAETGRTSEGVLDLLRNNELPVADIAIVIVGVNDISNDVPLARAMRARARIAALLKRRAGVAQTIFPGLPEVERFPLLPQPLAWYGGAEARRSDQLQARWAAHPRRRRHIAHIPMRGLMHPSLMAVDGFHPSPPLYAKVATHLADVVATRLRTNAERADAEELGLEIA
jgi:lysophospholipase L1-like esterase